jgi:protein TonB
MKTFVIAVLCLMGTTCLLPSTGAFAQTRSQLVYTTVERQPEFPGGKAALSRYLAENIRFPSSLMRKNQNTGPVAAKFIVDKDGSVHDVRISTKPLDKKAQKGMEDFMTTIIAAIEQMPRWRPGEVKGEPVAVFYTLPIEVNMQ